MSVIRRIAARLAQALGHDAPAAPPPVAPRQPAFVDAGLQRLFDRDGFVVVPIPDADLLANTRERFDALPAPNHDGFYSSVQVTQRGYREASAAAIAPLAAHLLDTYLASYRAVTTTFVCKTPSRASLVGPHQDWTIADERRYRTLNVWCPLVDVDERNGALHLLKGSHNMPRTIRGTGTRCAYEAVAGALTWNHLEYLPMHAGEALIYDVQMLHASPPNTSERLRPVASIGAVPTGAQTVHYFANPESRALEQYAIDDTFWKDYVFGQQRMPEGSTYLGTDDTYVCPQFTMADVEPLFTQQPVRSVEERRGRQAQALAQVLSEPTA